jgi:hypothetical protein
LRLKVTPGEQFHLRISEPPEKVLAWLRFAQEGIKKPLSCRREPTEQSLIDKTSANEVDVAGPTPPPREDVQAAAPAVGTHDSSPATPTPTRRRVRQTKRPALPKTLEELAAMHRYEYPRQRNVPSFLEMIDRRTRETCGPVPIHFDDIRRECHDEGNVSDDTIKKNTLIPARKAIVAAGLSYQVVQSGTYAVVKKIPSEDIP